MLGAGGQWHQRDRGRSQHLLQTPCQPHRPGLLLVRLELKLSSDRHLMYVAFCHMQTPVQLQRPCLRSVTQCLPQALGRAHHEVLIYGMTSYCRFHCLPHTCRRSHKCTAAVAPRIMLPAFYHCATHDNHMVHQRLTHVALRMCFTSWPGRSMCCQKKSFITKSGSQTACHCLWLVPSHIKKTA